MDISIGLSIEQQFSLRVYKEQIDQLDLPTTQYLLLEVLRQSMVKEKLFRELIKNGIWLITLFRHSRQKNSKIHPMNSPNTLSDLVY
jgi:hypothetical protein